MIVLLAAGTLAGCAAVSPAPAATAAAAPATAAASAVPVASTSSPAAPVPLTCGDVVPEEEIVQALAAGRPSDDWVVLPSSTAAGMITGEKAVEGAGGLSCSWKAGPPASEVGVAVLTVSILPGAADEWTGELYGDGPTSDRRTFESVSAAATCGDPGCGATAAVGSSWVRVDLATGPREGGRSAFAKETDDEVFDGLTPAVESAFRAVQQASAEQLRFPDHVPADGAADCRNYLKKAALARALDVADVRVSTDRQPDPVLGSIFAAAEQRLGTSVCSIEDPQYSNPVELASVTVVPEQSWAVDEIASDWRQQGDLREVRLEGLVPGERALSDCGSSGNQCTVVFTLGTTAIQIGFTDRAVQVAEAILAEAR